MRSCAAAREINRQGVKIVLVSMGAKGILLVSEGQEYLAVPPNVNVESTIGAGDSSVAGFIKRPGAGQESEGVPGLCRSSRNGHDSASGNGALPRRMISSGWCHR